MIFFKKISSFVIIHRLIINNNIKQIWFKFYNKNLNLKNKNNFKTIQINLCLIIRLTIIKEIINKIFSKMLKKQNKIFISKKKIINLHKRKYIKITMLDKPQFSIFNKIYNLNIQIFRLKEWHKICKPHNRINVK